MKINYINLTPHDIVLNDGTVYPASGTVARVQNEFTPVENVQRVPLFTKKDDEEITFALEEDPEDTCEGIVTMENNYEPFNIEKATAGR